MRRFWIAWLLGAGLLCTRAAAESIATYHTAITVHPSGALHIEETIRYDFGTLQRHGIFRDIPLTIRTDRYGPKIPVGFAHFSATADGKPVPFVRSEIASHSGGTMARFRIGNPGKTITGLHTYHLRYDAKRGVYPSAFSGMEAIRWNAVGSGSEIPTQHAIADLFLPDTLDRDAVRIQVFTGSYGSTDSRADYQWVDNHHIRFHVDHLAPHEALTVEANYPRGILQQSADGLRSSWLDRLLGNWHWGAAVGFFLLLWRYAREFGAEDRAGSIAPQYYPPDGISLLQSGLIYDKFADKKDFSAAILELGARGYLTILQPGGSDHPMIRRTDRPSATDDLTPDQRYLLEQVLFKYSNTYHIKQDDAGRAERINTQLDQINAMLYDWSVTSGQMRTNPQRTRKEFLIKTSVVGGILILLALYSTFKIVGIESAMILVMATLFIGVGAFILTGSVQKKAYGGIFFGVMWLGMSLLSFGSIFFSNIANIKHLFFTPAILVPLIVGVIWYFYRRIGLFTPKGLETYRYLRGYSAFMKRVEQDRIRRFLAQDPHYLDRGLPYAVLFGHNKHWIGFYTALNVPQPDWYHGDVHRMDDFSNAVQHQQVPPASESGGFSGGGSFSGGGGGGGGVGSW